ncbi:hypothetical protein DSCO28_26060 [Desulfosarcina ovata subsp. sediminis]|uniref:Acetolactate synthase n=1 Tax=Desulfosarcina ovata subsp. sediminis TaxID=885957 RepID=A0A5K7ZQL9_9BACT|nr:thiamine pyrophosphate-binding protein [Desulfosarcina ovata]BBO82040.1 hypothetical protein DSCO28_26060 [Desulfosarcina ovata subsp. sediminis]
MGETTYGGEEIGRVLKDEGVEYFFGIGGGHMWGIMLGVAEADIKLITMRHEQAGAYAADAYARACQKPGICYGTAGPGMENMVSAIGQAFLCRSPIVGIFGQHNTFEDGLRGLQVGSASDVLRTVTKFALRVVEGNNVAYWTRRAIRESLTFPQGPVALEFPPIASLVRYKKKWNRFDNWQGPVSTPTLGPGDPNSVEKIVDRLINAETPMIMAGDGVYWSNASAELKELVELLQIPVNTRRMGRGSVPDDHPLAVSGGYRGKMLNKSDFILTIGHPIGYLENYAQTPPFGNWNPEARYAQITEDPNDICLMIPTEVEVIGNIKAVLRQMIDCATPLVKGKAVRKAWVGQIAEGREYLRQKQQAQEAESASSSTCLHPATVGREIATFLDSSARDATVIYDAYTGTAFLTDRLTTRFAGQVLDAGEQGGVGHGVGMGIGAQLARPGKPVLVNMGDLGMGIGGMDVETAVRNKLPVVYLVHSNGVGMSGITETYFARTKMTTALKFTDNVKYNVMFEQLGIHSEHVEKAEDVRPALERAFNSGKTSVVNVFTDPYVNNPLNLSPLMLGSISMMSPDQCPPEGAELLTKFRS